MEHRGWAGGGVGVFRVVSLGTRDEEDSGIRAAHVGTLESLVPSLYP